MPKRRSELRDVPAALRDRIRPPLAVVLGGPAEIVHLAQALDLPQLPCYQMDLYPAEVLRETLGDRVQVAVSSDLWDLPADFQTLVYLPARGGERELKLDMIEQSFHILRPRGQLLVWSPYETDAFFPPQLKKVFGKVHSYFTGDDTVLACTRDGDRPQRRHEVTFQARVLDGPACRFVSRPGTFSYGRFDNGARALLEVAALHPGESVLDLGCGCGTNGIFAAQRTGADARIVFVDSNLRAIALTEHNASANGLTSFQTVASTRVEGLEDVKVDVVLANPPYFAHSMVARVFVERGRELLKQEGRFYLVTRQPNEMASIMAETFDNIGATECRGYVILSAG